MKLVTFVRSEAGSKPKIGAWVDGDIVDIEAALRLVDRRTDSFAGSLKLLIAAGAEGVALAGEDRLPSPIAFTADTVYE